MEYDYNDDFKITPLTAEMCQHFILPEYLISNVLAYGEIACIFGAPGAGKSLVALFLAYMISRGDPISGIKTTKGSVLYLAFEDYDGIIRRVAGLHNHYGPTDGFFVHGGIGNLYEEDDEDNSLAVHHLAKYVRENKISLVIIDTLSAAFHGLEENNNKSMSRVVERAKYLADKTGAAIILVHHNTKSDGTTPRGHGVLLGAVDIALQVRQSNPGIIKVELTKIKNGSKETTFSFQIHIESIGVNFDGNTITVAVCEEPDIDSRPRSSCSKAELSTLQILDELQQSGPVRESDWLSACATGNRVSEAAQPASRLRGARRNIQSLMDKGLVVVTTGIVSRNVGKI